MARLDRELYKRVRDSGVRKRVARTVAEAAGQADARTPKALNDAANNAVLDPIMTGAADYANALDRGMTAIYAGEDIQAGLNDIAKEWDRITQKLGVAKQRASYAAFLKLPGSTGKNTVAKRGQAVKISA